jgi:hypothetical protein
VPLRPAPGAGAPALVELRAAEGQGRYVVLALGPGEASANAALGLVRELGTAGRTSAAAQVARAFALAFPGAPGLQGLLAEAGVPDPAAVATLEPSPSTSTSTTTSTK